MFTTIDVGRSSIVARSLHILIGLSPMQGMYGFDGY